MSKKLITINVLMWASLILLAFIGENVIVFDVDFSRRLYNEEFWLLFAGVLGVLILYFFLERKKNNLQINWLITAILVVVVASNITAIFFNPSTQYISVTLNNGLVVTKSYTLDPLTKFKYSAFVLLLGAFIYIILVIMPKKLHSKRQLNFFFYIMIFVAFASCIYSYALEWPKYVDMFNGKYTESTGCQSFFVNPNIYGFFMILAIVAVMYLQSVRAHWWNYLIIIFFAVNNMFSVSRSTILIGAGLIIIFVIMRFTLTLKGNVKRNIISISVIGPVIGISVGIYIGALYSHQELMDSFIKFWQGFTQDFSSNSRYILWQDSLSFLTGPFLAFGRGYNVFGDMLAITSDIRNGTASAVSAAHNGYVEVLSRGGIVWAVIYVLAIIYLIYVSIRIMKKETSVACVTLFSLVFVLAHAMIESTFFFELSTKGGAITILTFVPALSCYYRMRNSELASEFKYSEVNKPKLRIAFDSYKVASYFSIISTFLVFAILGASPFYLNMTNVTNHTAFFYLTLFICLLTGPRIVMNIFELFYRKNKLWIVFAIVTPIFLILLPIIGYVYLNGVLGLFLLLLAGLMPTLFITEMVLGYIKNIDKYFVSVIAPLMIPGLAASVVTLGMSLGLPKHYPSMIVLEGFVAFEVYMLVLWLFPLCHKVKGDIIIACYYFNTYEITRYRKSIIKEHEYDAKVYARKVRRTMELG